MPDELEKLQKMIEEIQTVEPDTTFMRTNLFGDWFDRHGIPIGNFEKTVTNSFSLDRNSAVNMTVGLLLAEGMSLTDIFDPAKGREKKNEIGSAVMDKLTVKKTEIFKGAERTVFDPDIPWVAENFAKAAKAISRECLRIMKEKKFSTAEEIYRPENKELLALGSACWDLSQELARSKSAPRINGLTRSQRDFKDMIPDLEIVLNEIAAFGTFMYCVKNGAKAPVEFYKDPGAQHLGSIAVSKRIVPTVLNGFKRSDATMVSAAGSHEKLIRGEMNNMLMQTNTLDVLRVNLGKKMDPKVRDVLAEQAAQGRLADYLGASDKAPAEDGYLYAPIVLNVNGKDLLADPDNLTNVTVEELRSEFAKAPAEVPAAEDAVYQGKPVSSLKWGIHKDGHTPRLYFDGEKDMTELTEPQSSDHRKVSQKEVYYNGSDNKTKENFMNMARVLIDDRDAEYADPEFCKVLDSGMAYLTAEGRRNQQDKLGAFLKQIRSYQDKAKVRISQLQEKEFLFEKEKLQLSAELQRSTRLGEYEARIQSLTSGELQIPEQVQQQIAAEPVTEPSNTALGAAGVWTKDNGVLFPHEPSPADIKQGLAVQDCYMLASLIKIADTHPEKIKEAMKDNGNGTVTVRFNDYDDEDPGKKRPVYITVKKTENKYFGSVNAYSSGSTWVAMMEKAWDKYQQLYGAKHAGLGTDPAKFQSGMGAINRDTSDRFMNAFGAEEYIHVNYKFGYTDDKINHFYHLDKNGDLFNHPKGYLPHEKELYDFFKKHVNQNKETIIMGSAPYEGNKRTKALGEYARDHGIRTGHAYPVMKVFEKSIDGHQKLFVQLRDPYAGFTAGYDANGRLTNTSSILSAHRNAGTANMGTFDLELTDFMKIYDSFCGIPKTAYDEYDAMIKARRNYDPDDSEEGRPLTDEEKEAMENAYRQEEADYQQKLENVGLTKDELHQLAAARDLDDAVYLERLTAENERAEKAAEAVRAAEQAKAEEPAPEKAGEQAKAEKPAPEKAGEQAPAAGQKDRPAAEKPLMTLDQVERLIDQEAPEPEKLLEAFRALNTRSARASASDLYTQYQCGELLTSVGSRISSLQKADPDFKTGFNKQDIEMAKCTVKKGRIASEKMLSKDAERVRTSETVIKQIEGRVK